MSAENVDGRLWKNNTSLTRYSCDFPELLRHIQRTVPMPEGWWPLPPIVATPWFVNFLISPSNMFRLLQMWTFALLSQTIVVEYVSYGSKSLGRTRSSTFITVVSADDTNFTNGDLVAFFFLIMRLFLCLYFFVSDTSYGRFSRTATSWAILVIRGASHKTEFVPHNSR